MKLKHISILFSSVFLLSCQQYEVQDVVSPSTHCLYNQGEEKITPLDVISAFLVSSSDNKLTRSTVAEIITPYLIGNDTAFYFVNHPEGGFDIYANSFYSSMCIGVCPSGCYCSSDPNIPAPVSLLLDNLAASVIENRIQCEQKGSPIDSTWLLSRELPGNTFDSSDNYDYGYDKVFFVDKDSPILGTGYWVPVDSISSFYEAERIDHLLKTRWGTIFPI